MIVENADNSTFVKIDNSILREVNMEKKSQTRSFYRWVDDVSQDYSQDSLCGFLDPDSPEAKKNDGTIIQVTWPEKTNGQTYKYPARKETHEVKSFNLRIFSHCLKVYTQPLEAEKMVSTLAERLNWNPSYHSKDAFVGILADPDRKKNFLKKLERAIKRDNAGRNFEESDSEEETENTQYKSVRTLKDLCNMKVPLRNQYVRKQLIEFIFF